jgi:uncharacterized protein (TIGR02996 family)
MNDEDAFWEAVAQRPDDDLPKLVFADWLDERGDPRGACWRWVVRRRVRPARDVADRTWDWWSRPPREPDYYPDADVGGAVLPPRLFRRLKGWPHDVWKGYVSYRAALDDLCRAWAACAAAGLDPLGG